MGKDEKGRMIYLDLWPKWLDLEELIYRPVLQKAAVTVAGTVCSLVDRLYAVKELLKGLFGLAAFLSRFCDYLMDNILVFFRSTTHRNRTEQHVYLIGSKVSRTLGMVLDYFVKNIWNRTIGRKNPVERSFVVTFAEWEEMFRRTNRLISVSLSFGLMLAAIGLGLTLVYLLWW